MQYRRAVLQQLASGPSTFPALWQGALKGLNATDAGLALKALVDAGFVRNHYPRFAKIELTEMGREALT